MNSQNMPPTILALGCLLLISSTSAAGDKHLQVLSEVLSGPAHGRPLVLHLDAALPAYVQQTVVGMEAVRCTPHLTVTLGLSQKHAVITGGSSSSNVPLHVVLWVTLRPYLLQALWLHWKPCNLLLFSLGPSPGTELLRHEALSGVEKVALIGHLSPGAETNSDALGVYTVLPFSSGVHLLGPWRREAFTTWEALFPDRFPSFGGYTFHVAYRIQEQSFWNGKVRLRMTGSVMKASMKMLNILSVKLNFTYTRTINSQTNTLGSFSNGSWNGVFGMMERRETNFTINPVLLDVHRAQYFDFSTTLLVDGFGAFLMRPSPLPRWMSISRMFSLTTCLATFFALVAVTCFTLLQGKVDARLTMDGVTTRAPQGVSAIWLDTLRPLVGQAVPLRPLTLSARTLLALWFLQCLVITVAYTSNLVGIFTNPAYPRRLRDLKDIVDNGYRFCSRL